MAKGQVRGNKEARTPKKEKPAPKEATVLGSQVKDGQSSKKNK